MVPYTWMTPERDPANGEDWYGLRHADGSPTATGDAFERVVARWSAQPVDDASRLRLCYPPTLSVVLRRAELDRVPEWAFDLAWADWLIWIFATGNGPFNGSTDWGDSVLELSRGSGRLVGSYTPTNQAALEAGAVDLGSTSPAILPDPRSGRPREDTEPGEQWRPLLAALSHHLGFRIIEPGQRKFVGMGRDLYDSEAVFRDAVDQCATVLHRHLGLDLRHVLYPDASERATNPRRADSDRDGIPDGVERGVVVPVADPPGAATGTDLRRFRPDLDPATRTSAVRADTDHDGIADGREDRNRNGRRDRGESDPLKRAHH